jgi:hypothetical protein
VTAPLGRACMHTVEQEREQDGAGRAAAVSSVEAACDMRGAPLPLAQHVESVRSDPSCSMRLRSLLQRQACRIATERWWRASHQSR